MKEKFEDTKGEIRTRKLKDIHNGQKKKDRRTNNDLQNITQKTKDRVTQTTLIIGSELRCFGRDNSSYITCDTRRVVVKRRQHHLI